ncbi:chromosome partitioning protein ParB [Paraburkholderia sp. Cy-641]|uniref:ParB N-terminal domain-containing protein n=1 Tax=Paraburkholderia sp. Cy-641 TaxID=2608337 RepID=UPI001424756D|nr:ParB N-terminal domain-containing protein [Paraburkholderia sp. Cy-641]NIF78075.1 chromosome partitioning protein ParB [Paraburkholderia sp. Cy-641]
MSASEAEIDPERERIAARRLDVSAPGPRAPEPELASVIRLKITDVMVYERNPRRVSHERVVELKESIRANGIEQIVTVTRRPGETRYVVAKGGNSRVTAATALYDETGDERFLYYDFVCVPYPGEARLLAAHLRENDQRADLCFWDKANGYLALKADMEQEKGAALSLREFSRLLEEEGTPVSHVLLALFQFAVDRLAALGPATEYLSRRALVDVIQPAMGALMRLARRLGFDDAWLQQHVIDPELLRVAAGFVSEEAGHHPVPLDAGNLVRAFRARCGDVLGVSSDGINRMTRLLEQTPDIGAKELRQAAEPSGIGLHAVRADSRLTGDGGGAAPITELDGDSGFASASRLEKGADPETLVAPDAGIPVEGTHPNATWGDERPTSTTLAPEPTSDTAADAFREALHVFERTCGLDGCVRDAPGLPYGFMVEPPTLEASQPALDDQARLGTDGLNRYLGWWWLVSLSRQNTASGLDHVPKQSVYARMARDDDYWARMCDACVGEPLLGDRMDVMFAVMLNPDRPIGLWWSKLAQAARAFRIAYPERFCPPRWNELDAVERLVRGEGA